MKVILDTNVLVSGIFFEGPMKISNSYKLFAVGSTMRKKPFVFICAAVAIWVCKRRFTNQRVSRSRR